MSNRESVPDPVPQLGEPGSRQWGPTSQPMQQPTATPPAAKTWALRLLGLVVLVALVLLIVALVRA